MNTVGLIGGIAPESTIEYYRLIIAAYRNRIRDGSYPPIIINSIDMPTMLGLIGANELEAVTDYLLGEVDKLARAGAGFAVLASNTPHIVFPAIQARSPIPLISIVEAACEEAKRLGLKRVGLFGTRFTMQAPFYSDVFTKAGIALVLPEPDEQTYIHDKYMGELVNAVFLPETRARLLALADALKDRHSLDGLILGGTELPLILKEESHNGIVFLDTTRIHVQRIVEKMLEQ